jgi:LDH2 family malate/lactate/ureidoglycolate dehydrogenase
MIDILAGCLSGAGISPEIPPSQSSHPQGIGHCLIAIRVAAIGALDQYEESLDRLAEAVHRTPRAAGTASFLIPGEPELRAAAARSDGIPVQPATLRLLRELGETYGIRFVA